ncbi:threonine--tRNA ligase MST1 KNAG_0E03820 [Huiozyma naganishii CBS 8797]|uniref:threonine--tRNA ligase n=1 Tax=Huiozyma naganishii (strain ATCC MYA-139 / BCRC 22969 / CBS 8797 / KCTC 17520 / NBRC 10181 / NCYC 3082 / Yp74L-3) TaxID=1071383 RepID=J7S818_HUIN7|nr:hypothetical protein KNAG_0E03820 [Kazachstania naganishii CBS 8797]CCK70636.1 hypothetical protein KNAG_0E03820 [Kazachstania naganishii CBS 8797]
MSLWKNLHGRLRFTNRLVASTARFYSKPSDVKAVKSVSQEIASKQKLYLTDPVSPGSIFFLPNGTKIFNKLIQFMKMQLQQTQFGYEEVITPLIFRKSLWEQSGHWDNYKEDMFRVEGQDISKETYGLKPMNCPGHCVMFRKFDHSYNELPLRYTDFSPLHRNEASGGLSGLTRLRNFHQDDGHIFCSKDQIDSEILGCLQLVDLCYGRIFEFNENTDQSYYINLSTRPKDHYIGDIQVWDHAESVLRNILEKSGKKWELNEGDGAFYGPKLDIMVPDNAGKVHQVATIQLDFQLPERFDLKFKNKDNKYERPIMIHRAIFGSVERFLSLLIDHYKGKWPFWLNPYQAMIIPVNTKMEGQTEACLRLKEMLRGEINHESSENLKPVPLNSFHFDVDVDARPEPVGYRIKDAISKHYSYLIMVGDEEVKTKTYSIRSRDNRKLTRLTSEEIFEKFQKLESEYK